MVWEPLLTNRALTRALLAARTWAALFVGAALVVVVLLPLPVGLNAMACYLTCGNHRWPRRTPTTRPRRAPSRAGTMGWRWPASRSISLIVGLSSLTAYRS